MRTARERQNIAAANAILTTSHDPRWKGRISQRTKTVAGYGKDTSARMGTDEWAFAADRKWRIAQFGKRLKGSYRPVWFWTTRAESGHASIQSTFGLSQSRRIIIWEKLCAGCLRGAACRTHLPNITHDACRQPDLFVEPPAQPTQEAMDL